MFFQNWFKHSWKRKLSFFVLRKTYLNQVSSLRKQYQDFVKRAQSQGYDAGYAQAKQDMKHTLTLTYQPITPIDSETSIVSSIELPINPETIAKFEADMRDFQFPTPNQSQLIYSKNRSTRVIAGAGSGKSTTLVLRVLMLHKYLKIPLNQITVFSFTRASCREFQEKIIKVFKQHNITVTEDLAASMVRTFHSKIREWSLSTIASGQLQFFEFLKIGTEEKQEDERESELNTKISTPQRQLLKDAYQNLFEENDNFRTLIRSLHRYAIRQSIYAKKNEEDELEDWKIRKAANRDYHFTKTINNLFQVDENLEEPFPIKVVTDSREHTFYANRYFPEWDLYIAFTPDIKTIEIRQENGEEWPERLSHDDAMGFKSIGNQKRTILQRFSNVLTLSNDNECNKFIERLKSYKDSLNKPEHQAPNVRYRITGDQSSSDIWEIFYKLGTFIENVGMEVSALTHAKIPFHMPEADRWVLQCLCMFWPKFDEHLGQHSVIRFHHGFAHFSENNPMSYKSLSRSARLTMSHIMIDEFQDISPEIVQWIRGYLRYMRTQDASTSLMVVGDDDQSIYGWRGSDPQFITEFDKHFPSDKGCQKVSMSDNFRSHQEIVNAGESTLKYIAGRDGNKHGKCSLGTGGDMTHIPKKDKNEICLLITDLWNQFQALPEEEKAKRLENGDTFLLVLSRSNNTSNEAKKDFLKATGLKEDNIPKAIINFMTIHRSKGLEADYCILLDDCIYNNHNPLKNFIYHSTGNFDQTYDEAQRDEAMRLAYVAITRTKFRCWWYGKPKAGGAMELLQSDRSEQTIIQSTFTPRSLTGAQIR